MQIHAKLTGTSPLSFNMKIGTRLIAKKIGESPKGRPSVGKKFNSDAILIFKGVTKIGVISKKDQSTLPEELPTICTVIEISAAKNRIVVSFDISQEVNEENRGDGELS